MASLLRKVEGGVRLSERLAADDGDMGLEGIVGKLPPHQMKFQK